MGTLADLAAARNRRARRLADAAERAARHPALRWAAGGADEPAHRRGGDGAAACGAPGPLRLADPGAPLCGDCYPHTET